MSCQYCTCHSNSQVHKSSATSLKETWDGPLQSLPTWQRDHWKVISKSRRRPSWPLAIVKITSVIFSSPLVFCSHLYGKCTSISRVCIDGTCLQGESFLRLSAQALCRWWVQLDLMRLEAHVGDVRSVHTCSMYTCSACLHARLCVKRIEPVYKCDIHTYPCCALETQLTPHILPGAPQMLLHALMAPVTVW